MLTSSAAWEQMRRAVPSTATWSYFDHAAVSPLPAPSQAAIQKWLEEATSQGSPAWPGWARRVEEIRQTAARLLGADRSEIAFVPNTTTGISWIAEGWDWQPGDNVVTLENEFPSNAYPWIHLKDRGVEARRVAVPDGRVDLRRVVEACDHRTRLLAVSWVGYASGYRLDLDELAGLAVQRGVKLLVDAIQGLGVFPLDLGRTPIDFLAADGHKWLMGPEGAGILYVRRDNLERIRPTVVGWHSVEHTYDYARIELRWRPDVGRLEGGSQNMAGILGLGASLEWLEKCGWSASDDRLGRRVLEVTTEACDRLGALGATIYSDRSEAHASGIVSFALPQVDPIQARKRCLQEGIVLSCRDGRLRISPHAYAQEMDLARLVNCLSRR
jgi:cysteine desulfurase / selenocysteine lyase